MLIINEIARAVVAVIYKQHNGVIWLQTGLFTLCDAETVPVFITELLPLLLHSRHGLLRVHITPVQLPVSRAFWKLFREPSFIVSSPITLL